MQPHEHLERFDRASALRRWVRLPPQGTARVHLGAFTLAVWAHLWLGDAWNTQWLPFNLLLASGTLALWVRASAPAAWLLCGAGLLGPLLFERDQLTQSALMLTMSAAMFLATARAHSKTPLRHRYNAALGSWQGVTIATYLWAGLHKLNRDFLNPHTSCAQYGWDKLVDYWHLGVSLPQALDPWMPWAVILTELGIALGLLLGLQRFVWPLAVAFHIPLTVTMAPAFALVMASGHVSFLTREDLRDYAHTLRAHKVWIALGASAALAGSLWLHAKAPPWDMILKEWLLWAVGALCVLTLCTRGPGRLRPGVQVLLQTKTRWPLKLLSVFGGLAILLNGLTPYLGIQYQHTGAMLSNMRIDRGCWNTYLLPESVRVQEEYIRFEHAQMGTNGTREEYEQTLTTQLWSAPQLRQIQRNWCAPHNRPIRVEGTWRGAPFAFEDLCDPAINAHFGAAGMWGVNLFPDFLRFQKNLKRQCPQACIH